MDGSRLGSDDGFGVGLPATYVGDDVGDAVGSELGKEVGSGVGLPNM